MSDTIDVWGVETNNLKNIEVSLEKHAINLIIGPSGSGKSSLAYDTVAQIGQHEFMSMFADNASDPTYKVKGYRNMVAAVPLKQANYNNNMRSTIGTYFGINRYIGFIFSVISGVSEDFFVLNKESNLCEVCHGFGTVKELDVNKLISFNTKLKDDPVRCWDRYKDFYRSIIEKFCNEVGIDPNKTFRELTEKERHTFLYGESKSKYQILYHKVNSKSSRTTKFYGVMCEKPLIVGASISDKYYSDTVCPCCRGKKYASTHDEIKVGGLSIGEYMITPFADLLKVNKAIRKHCKSASLTFALDAIDTFLQRAIVFNLGYLFFNRSIPTLSGGELQRLRMVQVFNTQLTDLLIVLDEPLGGLSGKERKKIYDGIIKLKEKHTLVIVDHSDIFVKSARTIIALGEKSGKNGGYLIDAQNYIKKQKAPTPKPEHTLGAPIRVVLNSKIYQYNGVDIELSEGCLNLITGASGIGKSTLIREYFPQFFDSYAYVNQRPILGNRNSNVATSLDIATEIFSTFAKKFKKDKNYFSNNTGNEGCCPSCLGAGYIEYGSEKTSVLRLECADCAGTGFNKDLAKHKINGQSIFDIWRMTVDEAAEFFKGINPKITSALNDASSILLGHLLIGQPTSTLSGGENIRIKLLKLRNSRADVLGVDEPFKGLSLTEIHSVVIFLIGMINKGKTIVVIDHNEEAFPYFANHVELYNKNGLLTDK